MNNKNELRQAKEIIGKLIEYIDRLSGHVKKNYSLDDLSIKVKEFLKESHEKDNTKR